MLRMFWIVFCVLVISTPSVAAKTYVFNFENDVDDLGGEVSLEAYMFDPNLDDFREKPTTVTLKDGSAALSNLQYLAVPTSVSTALDFSQPVQLDLRFRFEEFIEIDSTREFQRSLLTTTTTDQRDEGFTLFLDKSEDEFALYFQIGEGSELLPPFPSREGYVKRMSSLQPYDWHAVSMIFRLFDPLPRIDFIINGGTQSLILGEERRADIEKLIKLLSGGEYENQYAGLEVVQLFLGGFPVANIGCCDPRVHESTLLIDSLKIQTPKVADPNTDLNEILIAFSSHLSGEAELTMSVQQQYAQDFLSAFNYEWESISTDARAFLSIYFEQKGALFTGSQHRPSEFSPPATIAYFLKQWAFDNLTTAESFDQVEGWVFEESEYYPGSVADAAARIDADIEIDASYQTDPGFFLNGQEKVIRPTGLYVPPGEIVEVSTTSAVEGQGIKVIVGLQIADLESSWSSFARFPRISKTYELKQAKIEVLNPFGGGLYIEVPDGISLGTIAFSVKGAVKMPQYSTLTLKGHSDNVADFQSALQLAHVPWFEVVSDKFITTQPINARNLIDDPKALVDKFGAMFDAVNVMAGRPENRFRAEWLTIDAQVTVAGTAMAASYPTYGDRGLDPKEIAWESDHSWFAPYQYLLEDYFSEDVSDSRKYQRNSADTLWHEWGHLHNLPTLGCQEQESNVHLLAAVAYNRVLGATFDQALRFSGFQKYDRQDSALDTMLSPSWQRGRRLCLDQWDNEVRYQSRSWARIVEIGEMLGWEQVGAIHKAFYDRSVTLGEVVNYGIEDDDFVETASEAVQLNLTPVFEFWGVPVSEAVGQRLAALPAPTLFEARLQLYKSLIPQTKSAFLVVSDRLSATTGSIGRWDFLNENYSESMATKMAARVNDLLCRYYGHEALCLDEVGDADGDGIVNQSDSYPFDSFNESLEASQTRTTFDLSFPAIALDSDGDGTPDIEDAFLNDPTETSDFDGDGIGDNADLDDDDDGYSDEQETLDGTNPFNRFSCKSGCFSFDVDQSRKAAPLTDGLLVIRYLFGFDGQSLIAGALDNTSAERNTSSLILDFLDEANSELDIDGDGKSMPLTDGLLLIRYLFGFSGSSLISGAIGENAQRNNAEKVEAYIGERIPSE